MTNSYNMYPESSLWMGRTNRDSLEHSSPRFGGLGHASDYGVDVDAVETLRPVNSEQTPEYTGKIAVASAMAEVGDN